MNDNRRKSDTHTLVYFSTLRPASSFVVILESVHHQIDAAIADLRTTEGKPPAYRPLAAALHAHNIHGPLASADRHQGLFVSFFADQKFLGFPADEDANIAEQKLLAENPAALLIFKTKRIPKDMQQASRMATEVAKSPHWQHSFDFHVLDKQIVEIYIPNSSR